MPMACIVWPSQTLRLCLPLTPLPPPMRQHPHPHHRAWLSPNKLQGQWKVGGVGEEEGTLTVPFLSPFLRTRLTLVLLVLPPPLQWVGAGIHHHYHHHLLPMVEVPTLN